MNLSILYRDEWLVAVDKPAGQLVHPSDNPQPDDEVTMKILRDQIDQRIHTIHRLDRPTTGVLLFATDKKAARLLRASFEKHEVQKIYHAVINGHPERNTWTCREPLQKDEHAPIKSAETEFKILTHLKESLTLVEAQPKTGRFHQIRRHLLHIGHPIVGDYRYAGIQHCDKLGAKLGTGSRMLLQAKSLHFPHPITQVVTTITAPDDPNIAKLKT